MGEDTRTQAAEPLTRVCWSNPMGQSVITLAEPFLTVCFVDRRRQPPVERTLTIRRVLSHSAVNDGIHLRY